MIISSENELKEVNRRLGAIMALLLKLAPKSNESVPLRDKIEILHELGLRPVEIAKVLNRPATHINKELVTIRRRK